MKKPPLKVNSSNDFQTPPKALNPLLLYLKKNWVIWECASGNGNLVECLYSKNFSVIESDILRLNSDFLTWQPEEHFDCIVTNPPYSLKTEFLKRCYELGKPFALLMPLTTLETVKRQNLFKKYGVQLILFNKRINFETPSGKGSSSWFATAWFTSGLNLPEQLNFVEYGNQSKLF